MLKKHELNFLQISKSSKRTRTYFFFANLTPNLIQRETGFFELQTHFEPPKSQKKNR
jgi:hypothetical protein